MILLVIRKYPLDRFLSFGIKFFPLFCVTKFLRFFRVLSPYMPGDCLLILFTFGTLIQKRTVPAYFRIAFILFVSLSVCCCVFQFLAVWAYVSVLLAVLYILLFFEEFFFSHRTSVRNIRSLTVFYDFTQDRRSFVSRIQYYILYFRKSVIQLLICFMK